MKIFNLRIFIFSLLFALPVFINLGAAQGLRFDADPFNYLGAPSIPLSLIVFSLFAITNLHKLKLTKFDLIFIITVLVYCVLNVYTGSNVRPVLLALGMLIFLINIQLIAALLRSVSHEKLIWNFFVALSFVSIVKVFSDIVLHHELFSKYFIIKAIVIYNYYDYFPFFYLLNLSISVSFLRKKQLRWLSILNIIICFVVLLLCDSRLFLGLGLLFIPMVILLDFLQIKFYITYFFCSFMVVLITLIISLSGFSLSSDPSLATRFGHWHHFFDSFTLVDLLFPFLNEYRQEMNWGTFHNEYLEIFSYFGVSCFFYIFMIFKKSIRLIPGNRIEGQLVIVLLMLGGIIQLNMTNPYVVILLSFYFGLITQRVSKTY